MKIILNSYKDPMHGLDWHEQSPEIRRRISEIANKFGESIDYKIQETNLGTGADWPTITVNVISIAGIGFFALPEAHKRVREALEEWQRIGVNFRKFMNWLASKEPVVTLPIEIIFISASERLLSVLGEDDAVFLKYEEIEPVGSYAESSGLYDFRFKSGNDEWKVLINGKEIVKSIEKL